MNHKCLIPGKPTHVHTNSVLKSYIIKAKGEDNIYLYNNIYKSECVCVYVCIYVGMFKINSLTP
jgi:hypothetical protein